MHYIEYDYIEIYKMEDILKYSILHNINYSTNVLFSQIEANL